MTVLITLTVAGSDSGPFDLYSNTDGYVSAFETGVSKAALLAGYSSSLVPNGTTTVRVKSTGTCTNYIDITVVTTTTTTTTVTPIEYDHYLAERYDCTNCTPLATGVVVAIAAGTPVALGEFYVPSAGSGEQGVYTYLITGSTASTGGVILEDLSFIDCNNACNVTS